MNENDVINAILRAVVEADNQSNDKELAEAATCLYSQFKALMHAGFTREEAYGLLLTIVEGVFNKQ